MLIFIMLNYYSIKIVKESLDYELITNPRKLYVIVTYFNAYFVIVVATKACLIFTEIDLVFILEYLFVMKPVCDYLLFFNFYKSVKNNSLIKTTFA